MIFFTFLLHVSSWGTLYVEIFIVGELYIPLPHYHSVWSDDLLLPVNYEHKQCVFFLRENFNSQCVFYHEIFSLSLEQTAFENRTLLSSWVKVTWRRTDYIHNQYLMRTKNNILMFQRTSFNIIYYRILTWLKQTDKNTNSLSIF